MNYTKLYNDIINNALTKVYTGYTEKHHIVPRSLGGNNSKHNLVTLTAREHFLCHYLLAKMYKEHSNEWHRMNNAFMMMKAGSVTGQRYFNSKLYEALKTNFSIVMSKNQTGKNNSQFGTQWIHHIAMKVSTRIPAEDAVPAGWEDSRVVNFGNYLNTTCKVCGTKFRTTTNQRMCSKACYTQSRVPKYRATIDASFPAMLAHFHAHGSAAGTLATFGYNRKKREGYKYFTTKLKAQGIVLKRR